MKPLTLRSSVSAVLFFHLPNNPKTRVSHFRPLSPSINPEHKHKPPPLSLCFRAHSRQPPKTPAQSSHTPSITSLGSILPFLQSAGNSHTRKVRFGSSRGIGDDDVRGSGHVRSGGIGTMLVSTTVSGAKVSPFFRTLAGNPTFMSGLLAWALAQTTKVFLNFFLERKWDFGMLFNSGGMPSSHSALCTALTASVALCHGVGDSLFPVCLGFSLIVMYDAIGVRRHAGMQAEVLNKIIEDLFQGHPISQRKLKELLGHTPSQVIAGAFLGILVACICCQGPFIAI